VLKWQPRHNQPIDPVAVSAALGIEVQVGGAKKASAPQKVDLLDLTRMPLSAAGDQAVQIQRPEQLPISAKAAKDKPTILIVDDTPDNLTLLAHVFKDEYRVKIAHNGPKALTLCQSDTPPDLVLLDIMMPEMDGFEVAEHMRNHPSSEHIPIIFVTALTDNASREKGLALGAVDFVTKPVNPEELKIRVKNFMRYIDLHRELQSDFDNMMQNDRLKDSVEQITRHDMKAPLSGVIGLAQGLMDADNLTSAQREQIQLIEETALQVLDMFNLSNEIFKIEAGRFKLNPQPVPIVDTIRRVAILMRKTFAFKDLTIAVGTPRGITEKELIALGDPMLTYSVFQNLFKNACEAAPEGTTVTASIFAETPLRITLENQGCVPAAMRECFFEKFATSGKADGTGLGTYSAKLLVEAQNGQIAMATSEEKNITCLTLTFPRQV
jgi:CheY-like chemotaxis protein